MVLSESEKLFQQYYDRLIVETLHARAHINLWERLEKYKLTEYIDVLNQAQYFFSFTIKAHLDDVLSTLSRIVDKQSDSLTIWKFLNFIEQNLNLFSSQVFQQRMNKDQAYIDDKAYWDASHKDITLKDVNEDRQKLATLQTSIGNLNKWRDKIIAHIDHQFLKSGKIISKEYPLKIEELYKIVDTLFEILNRYSASFRDSTYAKIYPGEDDIQFIMDCVRFYLEEHRRQIQALIKQKP